VVVEADFVLLTDVDESGRTQVNAIRSEMFDEAREHDTGVKVIECRRCANLLQQTIGWVGEAERAVRDKMAGGPQNLL
jgi:hypothetical protein